MKFSALLLKLCFSIFLVFYTTLLPAQCWKQVASAPNFTAAVKNDGTLWVWGQNTYAQFGTYSFPTGSPIPVQIGSAADWKEVSVGNNFVIAMKNNGALWSWGYNGSGELGNGTSNNVNPVPTQIGTATDWQTIASSFGTTLALKTNGTLWAWGLNQYGLLGNGTGGGGAHMDVPTQVGTANDWMKFSIADQAVIALKTNGSLWTWGWNASGLLGNGTTTTTTFIPTQVGADTDWAEVAIGINHAAALKTNGSLWTWGKNDFGQLGDGTAGDHYFPAQAGADLDWQSLSAGGLHNLAKKTNGTLWAWGINSVGQLGNGGSGTPSNVPVQTGTANDWVSIKCGVSNNSFGIKTDGSMWAWGYNHFSQLGTGNSSDINTPTNIGCASIVVPVKLTTFNGKHTDKLNVLFWTTAQESNSFMFEIEQSKDGINFTKAGERSAAGNSNNARFYNFNHQPVYDLTFYRLKMVAIDGSFSYSPIIDISRKPGKVLNIYPNPVQDKLFIEKINNQQFDRIIITDLSGKKLVDQFTTVQALEVRSLAPGMYILQVYLKENLVQQERVVKQ